jgi:hypothetical protein
MNVFLVFLGGAASLVGLGWMVHVRRLRHHEGSTRAEFTEHFEASGIPTTISGAVYDHFQKLGAWKDFMPKPSDTLEGTYKTSGEDVEDNVKEVLQQLGYEMPHSGILAEWPAPLETLEDVVRFVDWVRTKQTPPVGTR